MSRPLRIEFPGAVYHVTSRGDRREPIYRDDEDRLAHLDVIASRGQVLPLAADIVYTAHTALSASHEPP
jgi:N12 class adenine-specific DNA methylase